MDFEIGSGNVFKDLGLPNAEELLKEAERLRQDGYMIKQEKQLIVTIDAEIIKQIKMRAIDKNISIKKWVLQAIAEQMKREDMVK